MSVHVAMARASRAASGEIGKTSVKPVWTEIKSVLAGQEAVEISLFVIELASN
jgi:hypothetical protein